MKMKHRYLTFLILPLLFAVGRANPVDSSHVGHQSVGLVLSGGGAKGIAHIGVIRALEDNGIPIDYVAGTSMGAIVGGLYACGYTTEEMLDLILSEGFGYWSTGTIDPRLSYYLNRARQTPAMFTIPISIGDTAKSAVPQSLISPLPMNFAFMELFSPFTAQIDRNFNRMMVPYRCVASDVAAKHKKVFSSGSVGDAIRASMSFPAVFQPTEIDGVLYYDGGIYDNFPVDVMRSDFAPSIMIGVDVSTEETGPQTSIIDQLSNMIVQNNDYDLPADEGIKLRIDLNEFGLLDFPKAQRIYKIGYDHAMSMMDSIKSRIYTRTDSVTRELRRDVFKSQTPYLRFDSITVSGGSKKQNEYIDYLFRQQFTHDTLSVDHARRAYYMAISSGKLSDLNLQADYNDSTDLFSLNLDASVKNDFKTAFGGYLTSSTNSYLFLSAGYSTLSFNSISANANVWLGQSDMAAMLNGDISLPTSLSSRISVQVVASRHKFHDDDYMFYKTRTPAFIVAHQYFTRAGWVAEAGYLGKMEFGIGYGHLDDSYYRDISSRNYSPGRHHSLHNLGQVYATYETGTLDDINFPTKGYFYRATLMGLAGDFRLQNADRHTLAKSSPSWAQLELRSRNYMPLSSRWTLGVETDLMLSTRKLYGNYNTSLISAPYYAPTPAAENTFNPAFRANSFLAATLTPIYRYNDNLSARLVCSGFMPWRRILESHDGMAHYGRRLSSVEFFGEADITYSFPFASLSAYVNYASSPAHEWNIGLSFGIYIRPPDFMR